MGKERSMFENQTVMNVLTGEQFAILLENVRQQGYDQAIKETAEDDRLSAKELATRLGIDEDTVRRMANTDPLFPYTPIGKSDKRYSFKRVVNYLDSKRNHKKH